MRKETGKKLNVIYTNADQLINKRDDLSMFIADKNPDIIMVTEVIPKAQVHSLPPSLLAIDGYTLYTNFDISTRNLGSSGIRGIAIFVHSSIKVSEVSFSCSDYKEQLWVKIPLLGPDRLLIGGLYRSPSGDGTKSVEMLADLLKEVTSAGFSHIVIAGDFNMPTIDWSRGLSTAPASHCSHMFIDVVQDCFLEQHILQPTRYRLGEEPHTLDLVFSNEDGMIRNIMYHPGLGKSDHVIITFDLECYTHRNTSMRAQNLHKTNFSLLNTLAKSADWEGDVDKSMQERYDHFKRTLHELTSRCAPPASTKAAKKNIYMTREALKKKKKKRSLWLTYLHTQDPIDYARYIRCRNDLRRLTRNLRQNFEKKLAKDAKQDSKAFWRYVHSRTKTRTRVEDLKQEDGSIATEDSNKAGVLNSFFSSMFTDENDEVPQASVNYSGPMLEEVKVTPELVKRKLKKLRPYSSPGPDQIHPRVLFETAESITLPLTQLFQESLQSSVLPSDWKLGDIVPIFKKGCKQTPANYRPVSLTAVPCKVLESIIRDEILCHMTATNQLHNAQHGFRPKRSCATQLLEVLDDWSKATERGEPVDAIYLDFSKAYSILYPTRGSLPN